MLAWVALALPYAILSAAVWIAYWDVLHYGLKPGSLPPWVSDDVQGIAIYDGKMQTPLSWHNVFKWLRYHAAKRPNPNRRWKQDKQPSHVPNPAAHHRLNLWFFSGLVCLLYTFLSQLIDPALAFAAILLWVVHPLGVQTVGWISGIGYVVATFFMLLGLNGVLLSQSLGGMETPLGMLGTFLLYGFWQWMAVECQFATMGATALLLLLHQWPFAIISGLIACYGAANTLREAVILRKTVFKDQQMEQSTKFYPRKLIVVLKTLYYDVKLTLFPKRLGLYHTFCYHYELPYVEAEDRYWVMGLGVMLLMVVGIGVGSFPIQFGLVWFLGFVVLFLNWITANQFVVDRYVWLPSFGLCLVIASVLPMWVVAGLTGLGLARLWGHLPTYEHEEKFYVSNIWNFAESEVAYGNLGVTQLNQGLIGSAMDTWYRGIKLNPEYDVCWYNLSSCFKSRGPFNPNYFPRFFSELPKEMLDVVLTKDPMRGHFHLARYCLDRALKSRTCHFPKHWQTELDQLTQELARPAGAALKPAPLVIPLLTAALT